MVYNNSKKGAQGIGTLIIFIALILVAAVAAGVLISTVGKLQGKAEATGIQVQQKLGTGFSVFEVIADDTSDGTINMSANDTIATSLQLSPGSDAIKLSDITVTQVTSTTTSTYSYSGGATYNTTQFGVEYIKGPNLPGYLSKDDTVKINIVTGSDVTENSEFTIRFFPGTGNPLPVLITTPPAMVNAFTVLK